MIWDDRIYELLDRLADCEKLHENGWWSFLDPMTSIAYLVDGLNNHDEIATILLYEITSKFYFDLENYNNDSWKDIYDNVKLLLRVDKYGSDYKKVLKIIKENETTRNVRLQIIKIRHDKELYMKGPREERSNQFKLDSIETEYLKPIVFSAILRTKQEYFLYDRTQVTVYDTERSNITINKSWKNYRADITITMNREGIEAIKHFPLNLAHLGQYRTNYPIHDMQVSGHYDTFIFYNAGKLITEMTFDNTSAINDVPKDISDYAYGLAKEMFSILQKHGVNMQEFDRSGELYSETNYM